MEENIDNIQETEKYSKYNQLLKEFGESRSALKKMLSDVEQCKNGVLKSVVDSSDYRNKYAREERLKTLSSFFDTEIKIRQEYNRSILSEIEVRRKIDNDDDQNKQEIDIREIAKQLASFSKQNVE